MHRPTCDSHMPPAAIREDNLATIPHVKVSRVTQDTQFGGRSVGNSKYPLLRAQNAQEGTGVAKQTWTYNAVTWSAEASRTALSAGCITRLYD